MVLGPRTIKSCRSGAKGDVPAFHLLLGHPIHMQVWVTGEHREAGIIIMLIMCWLPIAGYQTSPKFSGLKQLLFLILKKIYLFIFRERGREGEREGEKHQHVIAFHVLLDGDLTCNPGICTDWELNQWLFGLQASTQSTEPHQPGPYLFFNT